MTPANDILADDILIEILSRLPVKSLLRFRCVSKTWLGWISSPHFTKLHLNRSSKILFSDYHDTYTIDYDPKGFDFPVNEQLIRGCCNGLLCLSDGENYMAIWNPATKEYVEIPYASVEDERLEDEEREVVVGFGFDPVTEQYKIVRSIFFFWDLEHSEFFHCEVKVCTLGTGEWRTVEDPPCCLRDRHTIPLVNGALHWLGGLPIGSVSLEHEIISFDLHSEEFRVVPWIENTVDNECHITITISVLLGCLSAFVLNTSDSGVEVWMMKDYGVKESWTKLFSIQMPSSDIECVCHIYAESLVSIKSLVRPETDEASP